MIEKPAVLVFDKAVDILLRIAVGGRETPLSVVSNLCAKQGAVTSRQNGGIGLVEFGNRDAQKRNEKARKNE